MNDLELWSSFYAIGMLIVLGSRCEMCLYRVQQTTGWKASLLLIVELEMCVVYAGVQALVCISSQSF